ncbi:MAG: hypothetical protein K2G53_07800, partial [Muribaculaceae bacterium]|nr:hypothetical protein [Muribaculaceae bacterium]
AKASAQADFANWMSYLPNDVFVAHVSIPGTHDTATGFGFCHSGTGIGGASYSQTQMARIDEQLAGGVRAFDFRPGVYQNKLYCAHGTDITNYTMEDAFTMLTDYLDAHPGEFFVIHFFRGNVGYSGTGMSTSEEDRNNYNKLIDEFFNKGKFSNYIVDYNPTLKVKDIRGKMVLFRRDRIDFAHFEKAGNFGEWPWEDDVWADGADRYRTEVTLASNPSIRGYVRVSDMSSPDNTTQIAQKKEAVSNLYNWCANQPRPNSVKDPEKIYRPDWCMTFTSGEYQGVGPNVFYKGGRPGYAYCAAELNPYYTDLIKNSTTKGPCGIILSDWVLTEQDQDKKYNVQGTELIPAIAYNNFDYISEFILDDALFTGNETEIENIWDESKQYFMRNVGTGDFLSAGEWYGTHATTAAHGIKITPIIDSATGKYKLKTTLTSNGYLDNDYYVDNGGGKGIRELDAKYAGNGKYVFTYQDNDNNTKAVAAVDGIWGEFCYDGTTHNVDPKNEDLSDPYQQWELISVDDYTKQQLQKARRDKGSDVSHLITGGRFFAHDSENDTWTKTGGGKSTKEVWGFGPNESRRALVLYNVAKSGWGTWDAKWTVTKNVTNLPKGRYEIKFKAYRSNISDMKVTINSTIKFDKDNLKAGSVGPVNNSKQDTAFWPWNDDNQSGYKEDVGADLKEDEFTYTTGQINITDGKLSIVADAPTHSSATAFILDDFELIYYGPIYPILDRAIADAKRRLNVTDETAPDWLKEFETKMNNLAYDQDDEGAAPALQIYEKLRELTLSQTPDDDAHQDYTNAFINAGFETGTMMGWNASYTGEGDYDTGVRPNEGEYATEGGKNQFLFNCKQDDPNPDNEGRGVILSQTIPGLPAGHYLVTARAANDEGDCMYIEVNGQRSEALVVEEASNISKLISFEFEVAENTEEVTISFMGGNSDGSFDDFGGNWYKLDDVHLYRSGSADYCVFYRRLLAALERVNEIAAETLPQYYQDLWDNEEYHKEVYQLIQEHINSDHSEGDLGGSNGLDERTELFNHFSSVVLSQAETKANMSGAIRNNSFELGDLSYWTTKASPIATNVVTDSKDDIFNVSTRDDKYIYYSNLTDYEDYNGESYPIYQTVTGLPKGQYKLSALVASNNGNQFYLAANEKSTLVTTENENTFQTVEVEFEITEDNSDLTLGLYPSADGNFAGQTEEQMNIKGPWFAVDNFQLLLVGREVSIDWEMETETHGTIILPFAVEADELEEKGLKVYSAVAHEEANAEGATHHILVYTEQPKIAAHTPYVVKRADADTEIQTKAVKAAGAREGKGNVYTFKGFTENEKMSYTETYTNGNLTGMLVPTEAKAEQYHLQDYEGNVGFVLHEEGVEHEIFEAYHAYITLPEDAQGDVNIHGIYFEEPTLPLDWEMEGQYYGTIILPFEAEIPEDMNAYTVTEVGEKKAMPGIEDAYYHLLTTVAVEETDGQRLFAANVPYLVVMKAAEEQEEEVTTPEETMALKAVAREGEEDDSSTKLTFRGQATNTNLADKVGLLTGVHTDKTIGNDDAIHVVAEADKVGGFLSNYSQRLTQIDAHHAYISAEDLPADHGEYLLLVEPKDDTQSGVEEIMAEGAPVDIFTPAGVVVRRQVVAAEALRELAPGVYILRSEKVSVKVIKK